MRAVTPSGSADSLDQRQVGHRAQWEKKKSIRLLYRDFHRQLLESCPDGRVLDIGGGTAHIKEFRPDIICADILPFPGIDVVADAHRLPFRDGLFADAPARQRVERQIPSLRVRSVDWHSLFAYPLSGGFQDWSLLPSSWVAPMLAFERGLPGSIRRHLSFRMTVVLERIA